LTDDLLKTIAKQAVSAAAAVYADADADVVDGDAFAVLLLLLQACRSTLAL
jgi:hypothetical protein